MTRDGILFLVILIINTLIAAGYLIWGLFIQPSRPLAGKDRESQPLSPTGYWFKAIVMFLCPVVGVIFFAAAQLLYAVFWKSEVSLEDVIFGKDKVRVQRKADEERERNRVPMEEALAVCDRDSMRTLMMDVVRGDVQKTLAKISEALNSEDTETSHYAATVLRDALNDFRQQSQELYNEMQRDEEHRIEYAGVLIEYMNEVLCQDVFPDLEQRNFVGMMEDACSTLYATKEGREHLLCEYMEWLCMRLLGLKEYEHIKLWCDRLTELYPQELSTYTVQLKLYFSMQDKARFFEVMDRLKKSDIVIDRDTLDLIRVFN